VLGAARLSATAQDDAIRCSVDGQLFGNMASKITMAALSLEPLGLASYGDVFMQFSERFCSRRASLLSENSFDFVGRFPGGPQAQPLGHRATWADRGRLALVEAVHELEPGMDPNVFPGVLLRPGATRQDDRFLEVHIYESWNIEAVEGVTMRMSSLTDPYAKAQAVHLGELLTEQDILWKIVE
jgi:hypothetical protein